MLHYLEKWKKETDHLSSSSQGGTGTGFPPEYFGFPLSVSALRLRGDHSFCCGALHNNYYTVRIIRNAQIRTVRTEMRVASMLARANTLLCSEGFIVTTRHVCPQSRRLIPGAYVYRMWCHKPTANYLEWLGAFAKLRKATISFVMSVCLSVRTEQIGSHWKNCHENSYLSIFRKSV